MYREANIGKMRGFAVLILILGLVLALICVATLFNIGVYDSSNSVVTEGVQG